jgi:hypothetical protein
MPDLQIIQSETDGNENFSFLFYPILIVKKLKVESFGPGVANSRPINILLCSTEGLSQKQRKITEFWVAKIYYWAVVFFFLEI